MQQLIFDRLLDGDNTLITDHRPELGPSWVRGQDALWEIVGGKAVRTDSPHWRSALIDAGNCNGRAEVTIHLPGSGPAAGALVIRAVSDEEQLWIKLTSSGDLTLSQWSGGTETVLSSTTVSISAGGSYRLAAEYHGAGIRVLFAGVEKLFAGDVSLNDGAPLVGIATYTDNDYQSCGFSHFEVSL